MKIVVTGQVGIDKKSFIDEVAAHGASEGFDLSVCNIGDMMYAEAPDVAPGKILDLPLSRLTSIRRSVFKDVINICRTKKNVLINTHATFRWRHGLFFALDYDLMQQIQADLYITVVDNVDTIHYRLSRDNHIDHTLKDIMVWREEETLATELISQVVSGHGCFYVMSRGFDDTTVHAMVNLIFRPEMKKAYLSFPMSHVVDMPELLAEIDGFRAQLKRYFICFDPGDLEEKALCPMAIQAAQKGQRTVEAGPAEKTAVMETSQLLDIIADIDGQIYARDFKLIDQSDMIISLIPALKDGRPGLSSGVERELQHAHEATKDVFVIWRPDAVPSPFITETATKVFRTTCEAVEYLTSNGYVPKPPEGTLFAS